MSLEATGFAPGRTAAAVPVYNGDTTVANAEALPKRLSLSTRRRLPRLIRSS